MKRIAILGSTGSIGRNALAVVDAHADRLQVVGLAAGENADLLAEQIARYRPRAIAMATGDAVDRLTRHRASGAPIAGTGRDGLVAVATHPDVDIVLCASSGTDGLEAHSTMSTSGCVATATRPSRPVPTIAAPLAPLRVNRSTASPVAIAIARGR